jgi:selenocysteine lyase/cysteine desulfurase
LLVERLETYRGALRERPVGVQGGGNGVWMSPHFFNLHEEIDRTVAAIKLYAADGLVTA